MGANITSGGIGKITDSEKLRPAKYFSAWGCLAQRKQASYKWVNNFTEALLERVVQISRLQ